METLTKIFQWLPYTFAGFILLAIAVRIIARISIRTWFEEKFKLEKENPNGKSKTKGKE